MRRDAEVLTPSATLLTNILVQNREAQWRQPGPIHQLRSAVTSAISMSKRGHEHWIVFRGAMLADLPATLGCTQKELPAVLTVKGRPKALKVGIMPDMLAKYPKADEPKLVNWVRRWTGHWEYLKR